MVNRKEQNKKIKSSSGIWKGYFRKRKLGLPLEFGVFFLCVGMGAVARRARCWGCCRPREVFLLLAETRRVKICLQNYQIVLNKILIPDWLKGSFNLNDNDCICLNNFANKETYCAMLDPGLTQCMWSN